MSFIQETCSSSMQHPEIACASKIRVKIHDRDTHTIEDVKREVAIICKSKNIRPRTGVEVPSKDSDCHLSRNCAFLYFKRADDARHALKKLREEEISECSPPLRQHRNNNNTISFTHPSQEQSATTLSEEDVPKQRFPATLKRLHSPISVFSDFFDSAEYDDLSLIYTPRSPQQSRAEHVVTPEEWLAKCSGPPSDILPLPGLAAWPANERRCAPNVLPVPSCLSPWDGTKTYE